MSFKVIDGDGPSKENRERERATVEFSWAIRDCAANMLRIIRGAGQPYEFLVQMQEVTRAASKVQETHGYWPQNVITNNLRLEDRIEKARLQVQDGSMDQATYDRSSENGEFNLSMAEGRIFAVRCLQLLS
jgi:hypothetical protein